MEASSKPHAGAKMTENEKIANLTSDAIRMSSDAVTKEIISAAKMAERVAADLRVEADQLASQIVNSTADLVSRINDFIKHCQDTSDKIKEVRENRKQSIIQAEEDNELKSMQKLHEHLKKEE